MPKADPSLSVAERVDAACDEFEREWRAGRSPKVDDYVSAAPETDRETLRSALSAVAKELQGGRAAGDTSVNAESVRTGTHHGPGATVARPADQTAVPNRIGRFEIRAVLGAGAFGCVYRAFDPTLDREVAIKVPLPDALRTPTDRERFVKEAKSAAAIEHQNICRIHEVGEHEGQPYIVMALVPGQSLAEVLRGRKEPLPEKQVAIIVRKLALALDAAHKKGVVHRDLKPANIMFDKEKKDLIVMDFGLARREAAGDVRATQTGVVMGTPAYMSPEQASGGAKDVGPAGDIFSLGVIMYELLTGTRPFSGTAHEVIGQILLLDPETPSERRPGVNPQLEETCLKALAKDPANRFASMKEFAGAIDGYLRPNAGSTADTARAVETTPEGEDLPEAEPASDGEALSTNSRKLAEFFDAISEERKLAKAETAKAVEEALATHRTSRWKVLVAILVAIGLASAVAAVVVVYFQNAAVTVRVDLKGIDLEDPNLTFRLDGNTITAEELRQPIPLKPGEHTLVVLKDGSPFRQFSITVTGGFDPGADTHEQSVPPAVPPVEPKSTEPQPDAEGFVPLFNGKDLTGWKTHPSQLGNWRVEDGILTGSKGDQNGPGTGSSHLYTQRNDYQDFHLRLGVRVRVGSSGVSFRAPFGPTIPANAPTFLAAYNAKLDKDRFGGLIILDGPGRPLLRDNAPPFEFDRWVAVEILVRGNRIEITMNGKKTAEVLDREVHFTKGHIALQQHGPATVADFRNIRVKEFPPSPAVETGGPNATAIVSTFDRDDEGWTVAGDARSKPTYHKDGGNPGGHLSAMDLQNNATWYWVAPAKFLGDRSASHGKTLSFDLAQSATDRQYEDDDVILEGARMVLVFKLPRHPDKTWTHYKVPLAARGWKVKATGKPATEDEMKAVLKSLRRLWIRGEYQDGPDTGKIDNVTLGQ